MKLKYIIGFVLFLFFGETLFAQDVHFSLYTESPLLLNPALAGSAQTPVRVGINYRNQWMTVGNAYNTFAASLDMPLNLSRKSKASKAFLGLGLSAFKDMAGDSHLGMTHFEFTAAGSVPLSDQHRFAAGMQYGIGQRGGDISSLKWQSQYQNGTYDPSYQSGESDKLTSETYNDIAYGLYYQFTNVNENFLNEDLVKAYAGIAVYHRNQPEIVYFGHSNETIYKKLSVMAGGNIDISGSKFSIVPNLLYTKQGPSKEFTVGALIRFRMEEGTKFTGFNIQKSFFAGLQYRVGDAIIPQIMYQYSSYQIGFSYDANISSFSKSTNTVGAFELSFKYTSPRKNRFTHK